MKKLISMVIILGFVIMLGAAGSADIAAMNFFAVLLLELLGMAVVLFGTSALMHYKRYVRRCAKHHIKRVCAKRACVPEKELC